MFDKVSGSNSLGELEELIKKNLFSMRSDYLHPYVGLKISAFLDTVAFIKENLPDAMVCNNRNEVFNFAVSKLTVKDGINAEFGVKSGKTINSLAEKLTKEKIYGFDSFQGIPEDWSGTKTKKGQLNAGGILPKTRSNVELVSGWFADSLPIFLKEYSKQFSLIHIDCDIYQSTKDIFDNLGDQIGKGTIIIFDEYFNYPNWKNHEHKAFEEFIAVGQVKFRYLCYAHTQLAVEIL